VGTVGVAYDATIVAVDQWDQTAVVDSTGNPVLNPDGSIQTINTRDNGSTTYFRQNFDVVNQSFNFGYFTPWATSFTTPAFYQNLEDAADQGRGGLGTIIVTAAGNHRALNWDTNASNLLNDRFSIVVASVESDGSVKGNSNPGANLLVSAFGSNIQTTDRTDTAGYNPQTTANGGAYTDFNDTSAAAPQVSGIVALMLEGNPNLGWRDVQTILAYTARHVGHDIGFQPDYNPTGFRPDGIWSTPEFAKYAWNYNHADNWNGGGLHFSNDHGFGLVDAHAAVRLAESWTTQSTSANEQWSVLYRPAIPHP
jgi:Subtilase family